MRQLIAYILLSTTAGVAAAATGIEESGFVAVGGIEQWVTIRGDDVDNPVLLIVHGGPGDVLSPHTDQFSPYEREFVVVQWDQRGSGRTYGLYGEETPRLSLNIVVEDGIEVAEYITRRLERKNVIVLGHSWGSVIAIGMVTRQPGLFSAYVGTGQVASWEKSVQAQFDFLRALAQRTNDQQLSDDLAAIQPLNPASLEHFRRLNGPLRRHLNFADTKWLTELREWANETLTEQELSDLSGGMNFSGKTLISTQMQVDLFNTAPRLDVPMFVIQGEQDLFTPMEPALAYFESVDAPLKELVIIEDAGHFALVTHQDEFLKALLDTVERVGKIK